MDEQDDIHTAYAKLYKVSKKHEKLHRLTTKKLSDVELDWEELSTKVDEANQTIGALRFENNFLAKKTKKLEAKLLQVRAQLERTSSAKLDEILSFQKFAFDRTGLGYDFSSLNIASSSTTVFVSLASNVNSENNELKIEVASENVDKGKSILAATLSLKRKRLETLGLRRLITKSLNRRSCIFVITVEFHGILVQIVTSDLPLNKAIVCSHPGIKINFHPLLFLLGIFLRPSCSFWTWTISTLPPPL